jgi:hypothetical protein
MILLRDSRSSFRSSATGAVAALEPRSIAGLGSSESARHATSYCGSGRAERLGKGQRESMHSRSGQANEAGSVHRRGVAAYLVAHGLAGRPVAGADPEAGGPTPVAVEFETAHATDDLLCTLSDGTRLFISAKRTCGDDSQLRDTLAQWVQLVDDLRPGDRLVPKPFT